GRPPPPPGSGGSRRSLPTFVHVKWKPTAHAPPIRRRPRGEFAAQGGGSLSHPDHAVAGSFGFLRRRGGRSARFGDETYLAVSELELENGSRARRVAGRGRGRRLRDPVDGSAASGR